MQAAFHETDKKKLLTGIPMSFYGRRMTKDDKGRGGWFHGCNEISVLCMTSIKESLQESDQYCPVGFKFSPSVQLICSIILLKSLSYFAPLLNLWEALGNQEMNIPVDSIAQTTALRLWAEKREISFKAYDFLSGLTPASNQLWW